MGKRNRKRQSTERFDAGMNPYGDSGSWNPDARVAATGSGRRPRYRDRKEASAKEVALFFLIGGAILIGSGIFLSNVF